MRRSACSKRVSLTACSTTISTPSAENLWEGKINSSQHPETPPIHLWEDGHQPPARQHEHDEVRVDSPHDHGIPLHQNGVGTEGAHTAEPNHVYNPQGDCRRPPPGVACL